jgi:cyclophilin family peptidyl-prolyl cis-trans isomerase/HEAT repeat protein
LNARQGPARARVVEALGKIAAALPKDEEARGQTIGKAILGALKYEAARRSMPDGMTILLGLTAVLRAKPEGAGPVVAEFLGYADPRIVADALNTMARLKLKDKDEEVRQLLLKHADPIVRANAARVAGAADDKGAFDALLDRALFDRSLHDNDLRVRVSAIRALGVMKERRAAQSWMGRKGDLQPMEVLEIATALGRIFQGINQSQAVDWLKEERRKFGGLAPELEIALVRISPDRYVADLGANDAGRRKAQETILLNWKAAANLAQAFGEIATMPAVAKEKTGSHAVGILRAMLDYRNSGLTINTLVAVHSEYAIPEVLRALAAFKFQDLAAILRSQFNESDVVVRATAAELLGELPPDEKNTHALIAALPAALADVDLNDAALAILDALGKQKSEPANEAIKTALASSDHLLRRKAVALLKANGAGDFSSRIGTVKTRNTEADYRRAIARIGKQVRASVETSKGSFTIEFLPEDAPLTVDNFIQLARKGFFNGQTIPRVVPNFVVQAGDPRGDQNGGPGYQIRCELNTVPFVRGMVGMALSGKDTGGSQWFVTHSPQPHLDGGYTVFGRVVAGMDVVDKIARGDVIRRVTVSGR